MILVSVGFGTELKYDFNGRFYVAFGKVPVVAGEQVSGVLNARFHKVSGIVDVTEAEARRIGL